MSNRTPHRVRSRTIDVPQTQGATALSYAPEPIPASRPEESKAKRRTTLSVVPAFSAKRKFPMLVTILLMIMASAVAVLLINIFIANGQYSLVSLKGQERALTQENEALRQQAQYLEAPQVIAEKATKLGMVKPGTPAAVNLDTGKVSGNATPAKKPEKGQEISGILDAPQKPANEVAAVNATKSKAQPESKAENTQTTADPALAPKSEPVAPKPAPAVSENGRPDFTSQQLNGGTIPAPSMKAPGN